MQQLGDVLKKAAAFLQGKGISEARLSAEWLLAHVLKMKRLDLYMNFDRPLLEAELTEYRSCISRRIRHEPIAYIIGMQPFYGVDIKVNSDVLIPRQETEELVDQVLKYLQGKEQLVGLDLCTGSGAIALALKHKRPDVEMQAADVSAKALEVAKDNALQLNQDVKFHLTDLVEGIEQKFDFVVCNPPYISHEVVLSLQSQVRDFEPQLALKGGDDGLAFYRRLVHDLPKVLKPAAKVFFEIGYDQGDQVCALYSQPPFYNPICIKDSNQKNRIVIIDFIAS